MLASARTLSAGMSKRLLGRENACSFCVYIAGTPLGGAPRARSWNQASRYAGARLDLVLDAVSVPLFR